MLVWFFFPFSRRHPLIPVRMGDTFSVLAPNDATFWEGNCAGVCVCVFLSLQCRALFCWCAYSVYKSLNSAFLFICDFVFPFSLCVCACAPVLSVGGVTEAKASSGSSGGTEECENEPALSRPSPCIPFFPVSSTYLFIALLKPPGGNPVSQL